MSDISFVEFQNRFTMLGQCSVALTRDVFGHVTDNIKSDAADNVSRVLKVS